MSNVPHYIYNIRKGKKYGDWNIVDGVYKDGIVDTLSGKSMGI